MIGAHTALDKAVIDLEVISLNIYEKEIYDEYLQSARFVAFMWPIIINNHRLISQFIVYSLYKNI